ncbi:MAG: valine--tRNA ligase [Spirochaetales bacterium]
MSQIELPKAYNPADFEDRLYQFWLDNDLFSPRGEGEPFVVAIPPPNVTGVLHMGHGLNNSLQDALVRYWRMKGRPTLWVPGTDHAGIATQQVVENQLRKEGKSRYDLGRKAFVERTWKVKEDHHAIISQQLKKIGASLDWKRERFTMDEGLNHAVRHVFVTLYERGLIYKGRYLVNWDPEAQTAISDDEVEYKEVQGALYHIRYPFADGSGFVQLATTRPETLLGDVAVAVHPTDERYAGLVGKLLKLPVADREIPLLADGFVDKEFGTGAVKITPAHDPNDFEAGRRHNLAQINILNPDGTLGPNVPERYMGLTTKAAREKIVAELTELGLFVEAVPHKHQVGHAQRSGAVVEPYLSEQWFVRMKPLAEKAMEALRTDQIRFYPKRYESTYTTWMEGIRDWCISRQLWWGHQIPVWTCDDCGQVHVKMEAPTACEKCGKTALTQDPDVLDTWFSSWLWPFSTLGWPEATPDLAKYYPTTAVVTAYDIIFFWVARMVMAGMEFTGKAPFRDIYMTPLVRDAKGRKMSKSLGNGIDPLEVVAEYGADALKFTMVYLSSQGQDINLDKEGFKLGSKFANKIWNASRYLLMNIPTEGILPPEQLSKNGVDLWIEGRLNAAIRAVDTAMLAYKYNDMGHTVYEFFWNDFCDWYVEATKLELYADDPKRRQQAASKLVHLLEESLRLMHPFLSFITEEIYQKLPGHAFSLVTAPYPVAMTERDHPEAEAAFGALQDLVGGIRRVRSEFAIDPAKDIEVIVSLEKDYAHAAFLNQNRALVAQFAGSERLGFAAGAPKPDGTVTVVGKGYETWVLVRDVIDLPKELDKLAKTLTKTKQYVQSVENKLSNQAFVNSAPADIVEGERKKLSEAQDSIRRLMAYQKELQG